MRDLAYLKLLSREYPNIRAAASDIINLQAICGLPKGTEYFFSDLHGERGTVGEPYLLSGKNDQSDQTGERIHGGLAEDGGVPSGADLPGGFVEIHPFQGEKKDAEGVFGCDR